MNDTISRQAAIKILHEALDAADQIADVPFGVYQNYRDKMNELPPAQPERIVRCKDCKHWIPYDWMFSEVWRSKNMADYPEDEIGCNYCDMTMKANDFCSRGERKDDDVTCENCDYSEKFVDGLILCRRTKTSHRVSATSTCGKGKRG